MLRGMDNFAQGGEEFEEGITINCNKKNHSNPKKVQSPRRKSPQDRESFTYEHFPVVCPTCRGTGKVRADDENKLVAFVPIKDERLRPSRIFWKMFLMLIIFACIAVPLAFFLIPRTVTINLMEITTKNISIPDDPKIFPYIIVKTGIKISNKNYLRIQISKVELEASWNKLILNTDTCQNLSVTVASRETMLYPIEIKMIFTGIAAKSIRDECAFGWKTYIPQKFVATAQVSYLSQASEISVTKYPYVRCYDFGN